jgi:hypothetical protein
MGTTRDVVERFYQRFGANDLDGAFACFAPGCIAVGLSGPLDNSAHQAAALALRRPCRTATWSWSGYLRWMMRST